MVLLVQLVWVSTRLKSKSEVDQVLKSKTHIGCKEISGNFNKICLYKQRNKSINNVQDLEARKRKRSTKSKSIKKDSTQSAKKRKQKKNDIALGHQNGVNEGTKTISTSIDKREIDTE